MLTAHQMFVTELMARLCRWKWISKNIHGKYLKNLKKKEILEKYGGKLMKIWNIL